MTDNSHRIIRQVLELDLSGTDQFLELQQTAAQVLQNQGMVAMESVFNQIAGPNQLIRLERLEINLGSLQGPDWPAQFSRRLTEQLQESLDQAIQGQTSTSSTRSSSVTVADSLFEQFLFFCQQGRLPWWGSKPPDQWPETLETTMTPSQWSTLANRLSHNSRALRRLVYSASDRFLQTFLQRLRDIPDTARVLVLLKLENCPQTVQSLWRERFWLTVLGYFISTATADGPALMGQLLVERQTIFGPFSPEVEVSGVAIDRANIQENLPRLPSPWQSWLESATQPRGRDSQTLTQTGPTQPESPKTKPTAGDSPSQSDTLLRESSPQDESSSSDRGSSTSQEGVVDSGAELMAGRLETLSKIGENHPVIQQRPQESLTNPVQSQEVAADSSSNLGQATESLLGGTDNQVPVTPGSPISPNPYLPSTQPSYPTEAGEDIYVEGAGMILLHPFLQELFKSLDLLKDRHFRDELSQRRAIALLTYLTFGEIDVPEYELLLPKLLCAWPWENPLSPYKLNEVERQASDELLSAVLKHWSALRSSSSQWLRETFFWRDGKLNTVDMGWRLTIERQAQDVLLNKLPWGIGVIRLPWMADFLYVSWTV